MRTKHYTSEDFLEYFDLFHKENPECYRANLIEYIFSYYQLFDLKKSIAFLQRIKISGEI